MESQPNRAPLTWSGLSLPKESQAVPPRKSGQTNLVARIRARETTKASHNTEERIKLLAAEFSSSLLFHLHRPPGRDKRPIF